MPLRRRRRPLPWIVVAIALLAAVMRLWSGAANQPPAETLAAEEYRVVRVVDGDTLLLEDDVRVRLIGVDTPETVAPDRPVEPWGPEATEFTGQFVSGGRVRLEFDRERVDRFDRFLAYVWVGDRMLNEELLRAGLATAPKHYRYGDAMRRRFQKAEDEARRARIGIWSE